MGARPASADPRSRRSREQILEALHRLAREGELGSIAALSAAAGVTRATFYNHFDTLEEAAWFAMLDSFDRILALGQEEEEHGVTAEASGLHSLRLIVEILRSEPQLVRLADAHNDGSNLPGLAEIFRVQTRIVWRESGRESPTAEVEVTYAAAGLYAVLAIGARGQDDPAEIARVAYSLLPDWMRQAD